MLGAQLAMTLFLFSDPEALLFLPPLLPLLIFSHCGFAAPLPALPHWGYPPSPLPSPLKGEGDHGRGLLEARLAMTLFRNW